jgi:alpha-1,2-mannosyltransferase
MVSAVGVVLLVGSCAYAAHQGLGTYDGAGFLDLGIYRDAVATWWSGRSPYDVAFAEGLQFNYPPSALVVLSPLTIGPRGVMGILLLAVGAVLLWLTCRWSLRAFSAPVIALVAGLLAMSEPVQMTWAYGQVDVLVLAAVTAALVRASPRADGVLLGGAAGLKLLPVSFLLVPALQRRWRPVVVALATAGVLAALALARVPSMLGDYLDQLRHGAVVIRPVDEGHNVSWRGFLGWAFGRDSATLPWLVVAVVLGVVGLLTVARATRRGDLVAAVSAVALLGLLLSPVTWTHHWVWVAVVLGTALPAWRSTRGVDRAHLVATLALALATLVWVPSWFPNPDHTYGTEGLRWVSAYSYVLLGTVVLVTLWLRIRADSRAVEADA